MDWDATSYTSTVPHCLRRLDENLHYPADLDGEVHNDGRIWSQAHGNATAAQVRAAVAARGIL